MNEERLFIVYTDIVGHTRLIDRVGVGFRPMRRVHDELFRQAAEAAGGALCSVGTGDGFYAGFTSVGAALDTALTFRRRLAATDWDQYLSPKLQGPENAVQARVGIHCGLVKVRYAGTQPADFDGLPRNTCDKLCALAKGNQVVMSREVWDEVRLTYTNAGELDHTAFGFFKPKDCKEVLEVFGVAEAGAEMGPCPEQPAEYGAVLFAYIDEAIEMLDRLGDERYEQQFLRLEGLLQDVAKKHAPAAFIKRLGKDGFLVSADTDVEIARVGIEFRRAAYGAYRRGELATTLKMGADCGSVHYSYGPRGREDVRDQPCNVAAKIAGKLATRWQLLIADRVKRNAHARLNDRDDYQWVSLGRRDPVGTGEGFEVIDLRDTRIRAAERPVLWVDLSHVLIQLGGVAEAIKPDLMRRLGELFDRAAGSCKVKPLKADHPAGFFAVFEEALDAFDTAVDFHAACVAERWEASMAGIERRHKRDSLARVGLMVGQVSSGVLNGWADPPEGPGVDAARQMMSAHEGPGVSVLVGNSMRSAVESGIAAMRGLGPEARAGRPPAHFASVRTSADWPEAAFGKVWGVEADARGLGGMSAVLRWGLLTAAAAAVAVGAIAVYRAQRPPTDPDKVKLVNQSPQLTSAIKTLAESVSASTKAVGSMAGAAFRTPVLVAVRAAGDSVVASVSSGSAAEQDGAVPELQRLTALATLLGRPGAFGKADEAAAARAYPQAVGTDPLRAWRTTGASPDAWAKNVAALYAPYTPVPEAGKETWKQALDAAAAVAAKNLPEDRRLELNKKREDFRESLRNDWGQLAFVAANREAIDRAAAKLDAQARGLSDAAAAASKLAMVPAPGADQSPVERELRKHLRDKLFPEGSSEQNRYWRDVVSPWAIDQLAASGANAATVAQRVGEVEAALREVVKQVEDPPAPRDEPKLTGDWRDTYREDCAVRRKGTSAAFYDRLGAVAMPDAGEIRRLCSGAAAALEEGDRATARSLIEIRSADAAMNGGASIGVLLTKFGGPAESLAEWYSGARDLALKELVHLPLVDAAAKRLRAMSELSKATSIDDLRALLREAQWQPEVVSAAWDRLEKPATLGGTPDAAWLDACAFVFEHAQPDLGGPAWADRLKDMREAAVKRVVEALSTPRARANLCGLDVQVAKIAAFLLPAGIKLEDRLNEQLPGEVQLARLFCQLRGVVHDWEAESKAAAKDAAQRAMERARGLFSDMKALDKSVPSFPNAEYKVLIEAFDCASANSGGTGVARRDFARLGPAVNKGRWRYVAGADAADPPKVVRYEYDGDTPADLAVAHGPKPGVNVLEFRLLETPAGVPMASGSGDPVYLCTTAMSVGALMIQSDPRPGDFGPGENLWGSRQKALREVTGPVGWSIANDNRLGIAEPGASTVPPKYSKWLARGGSDDQSWAKVGQAGLNCFPGTVSDQSPFEPAVDSPLQMIRPDAAVFIARTLGCRLPTDAEFAAAFDMEARAGGGGDARDPASWNLRDQSLRETELHFKGPVRAAITNSPDLRKNARVADFRKITDDWYASNDGAVLFMPVARPARQGNYVFTHLIGNVATYTFPDADTVETSLKAGADVSLGRVTALLANRVGEFHITGRSALSAKVEPSLWSTHHEVQLRLDELTRNAYGDVGLRLAFTARPTTGDATPCPVSLEQALDDMQRALNQNR